MDFKEDITKAEEELIKYCQRRNMQVHIAENLIFITTPFGKWYMDKTKLPIKLYHEDSWIRSRSSGKVSFNSGYHKQDKIFDSYIDALKYIYNHDFYKLKREAKREHHFVLKESHNKNEQKEML